MANSENDLLTVQVKHLASNTAHDIAVSPTEKVSDFKDKIQDIFNIPANRQNLVCKGRILFDDKTIGDYNIKNEDQINLVEKNQTSNTEDQKKILEVPMQTGLGTPGVINTDLLKQPVGGAVNLEDISKLMESHPEIRAKMNEMLSDPTIINAMLENPSLKPILDSNPFMRQMMSNPQFLQSMLDPNTLQMMNNMMSGDVNNNMNNPINMNFYQPLQPNPFLFQGFPYGNDNLMTGNMFPSTASAQAIDPKEKYKEQNETLKEMGFTDEDQNIKALTKTSGNVDAAVERILNNNVN